MLRAIDKHLDEPAKLIVIGGAAASLAYQVKRGTTDIDTMNDPRAAMKAYHAAVKDTGIDPPLGAAGVADAPYEYESRLRRLRVPKLARLEVLVPEKHDLVLMKIVRGNEGDFETAKEIATTSGLRLSTLEKRFVEEMGHVIGDPRRIRLNFLACVARVFGVTAAEKLAKRLK